MKKYLVIPLTENREIKLLFEKEVNTNTVCDMWVCHMTDEAMMDIQHFHCDEARIKTKKE